LTAIAAPLYGERRMTTTVDPSDGDLARAIAAPDPGSGEAAETELYRRFAPRVRLYGLRHLRDGEAARDLMQQVLLLTIEKLREGAVRDLDSIGSFILGASRMLATNLKRRERRREALRETFLAEPATGGEEGGAARERHGVRVRLYSLTPGEIVPCAAFPDDDLVVVSVRGDFAGIDGITLSVTGAGDTPLAVLNDVPVSPTDDELLWATPGAVVRRMPTARVTLTVTAGGESGRRLGEYVLDHTAQSASAQ
jgi:hypothetical protein